MKHTTSLPAAGARIATSVVIGLAATFLFACADDSTLTSPSPAAGAASLGRVPAAKQDRIVFQSNRDNIGNYDIYSMLPDGTGITRLTFRIYDNWFPASSPDGKHIVFTSKGQNPLGDIYVMKSDGTNITRLTNTTAANYHPTWSADGTKIIFTSTRNAADPSAIEVNASWEIYTMNADGSNVKRITNNAVGEFEPHLSPDGTKIAFASDRDHLDSDVTTELYVMNVDGTNIHRLTWQIGRVGTPSFDPAGKRIVYYTTAAGTASGIYIYDPSSRAPIRLTFNNGASDVHPTWSPDGKQIAYSHWESNGGEIFKMNDDGTGVTPLTSDAFVDMYPRWAR